MASLPVSLTTSQYNSIIAELDNLNATATKQAASLISIDASLKVIVNELQRPQTLGVIYSKPKEK